MDKPNKFDEYINAHPKESLQLALIAVFMIWQSMAAVMGTILYLLLSRAVRVRWWALLAAGLLNAGIVLLFSHVNLQLFIANGFTINLVFWKGILSAKYFLSFQYLYHFGFVYLMSMPLLFAGILSLTDLIKENAHEPAIKALQMGKFIHQRKELSGKKIERALRKVANVSPYGTVLGISKYTGKEVIIPDKVLNQIALVLGTTGSGKTITLRRFYDRAITQNYPLIIVDGKPSAENIEWLQSLASKHHKPFYGFNCGNYSHYDTMSNGGFTVLKDKIISLKDEWENDYYRSIAEDYLQATFEVLLQSKKTFDLKLVADCLNHDELLSITRELENESLLKRIASLAKYDQKDITGLRAHLNLLIYSELGQYFTANDNMFSLPQIVRDDALVYFALPALSFPSFSKVLGKLVINDLKATIDNQKKLDKKIFMVFDEFSVFAGEQVLNLVNMGRGKGVHAVFGTQGLADLSRVDPEFKSQVMNCVNTIICHRLNDQDSAEAISAWIGTRDRFKITGQINIEKGAEGNLGSVRLSKGFLINPEEIKQDLDTGEAYYASKLARLNVEKLVVKYL